MSEQEKNTTDKVKKILSERLSVEEERLIDDARLIEDLAADSLTITETMMALEDEFGLEIKDEDAGELKTVGAIIKYIKNKTK